MSGPVHATRNARPPTRRLHGVIAALLLGFVLLPLPASAARDRVSLEIRVIEATPGGGAPEVDPKLKALARDLASLPFKRFVLTDSHQKVMSAGERVSFEFPGKTPDDKKRFLVVSAHGAQAGGKLRFQLSITELKFDTLVAVPDGGTILVGGPRHGPNTVFFAVTARKAIGARGPFKR